MAPWIAAGGPDDDPVVGGSVVPSRCGLPTVDPPGGIRAAFLVVVVFQAEEEEDVAKAEQHELEGGDEEDPGGESGVEPVVHQPRETLKLI